jgi:hypothetical protein
MKLRALLVLLVVLVFGGGFSNGRTTWDDGWLVFENPSQERFGAREVLALFDPFTSRQAYGTQYTPLSDLSYAADRALFGVEPGPYHLQGILFHAAEALLVHELARRLGLGPAASFLAAALFAVHPLQVESVTWISGRRTVLCGALCLGALVAWERSEGRGGAAAFVLLLLANLAKQYAVVLPALFFLLDRARDRRPRPGPLAAAVAISAAFVVLGIEVAHREGILSFAGASRAPGDRVALVGSALAHYYGKVLWPARLSHHYRLTPTLLAAAAGFAGTAALALLGRRTTPPALRFGGPATPVALVPGCLGVGSLAVADRYAYLALAGIGLAAAFALERLGRRERTVATAAGIGLVVLLGIASAMRVGRWRDDVTLFRASLAADPADGTVGVQLGTALLGAGRAEEGERELERVVASSRHARPEPLAEVYALIDISAISRNRGDAARADRMLREAEEVAERTGIGRPEVARERARVEALGSKPAPAAAAPP